VTEQEIFSIVVEFCNEWPKELATDEICDRLFPIEVITRDVVADGSSTRDPRARLVTVQVITDVCYHNHSKFSVGSEVATLCDFQ